MGISERTPAETRCHDGSTSAHGRSHECPSVARRNAWNDRRLRRRPKAGLRACKRCGCIGLITFPCEAQWSSIRLGLPTVAGAAPELLENATRKDRNDNAPASRFTRSNRSGTFGCASVPQSRESGIGNRESGIGNRESGIGNQESGTGRAKQALPNPHSRLPGSNSRQETSYEKMDTQWLGALGFKLDGRAVA